MDNNPQIGEIMKLITFIDIQSLNIPTQEYYRWVEEMIQHKEETVLPPKISLKPVDGVFFNVMPSIIKNKKCSYGGVKVVTRYPERTPALDSNILLFDAENGKWLAYLDGNIITAMRTGAVAAHSIMLLAKKDYQTIGVIGAGNVSRATVLTLLDMNPNREFYFKILKYKNQAEDFANRFKEYKNAHFEIVNDVHVVAKASDVIISGVTYAPKDFCNDEDFCEGVLVVPIHTLGFTNCDFFFDKVFADDYGHVCHFKNFAKFKKFAEIADVSKGKVPGRENNKERILVYNIGISMHDVNFAAHIYELLKDNASLQEINMEEPKVKFWI